MTWSWTPHLHPEVWVMCGILALAYVVAVRRRARAHTDAVTRGQARAFTAGVVTIFVAAEWPVHDLAEGSLYSIHMVQHLLLTLVAPAFLLAGTPPWMARALLPPRVLHVVRLLARPLPALVIFNVVIVFTHWPKIVGLTVHSEIGHFALHVLLVGSALLMWMPVLSPILEIPRLSYPGQMLYLFLQSIVPTVPASFLTFGERPLYAVYEALPKAWGMSAITDQRSAGLIMKIVGGFVLWGVIASLFFKWFRMEQEHGVDALGWRDVDRSLNRMELNNR